MVDTASHVPEDQQHRLAVSYTPDLMPVCKPSPIILVDQADFLNGGGAGLDHG